MVIGKDGSQGRERDASSVKRQGPGHDHGSG